MQENIIRVAQPLLVGVIIRYFSQPNLKGDVTPNMAYWSVFGLCITSVILTFGKHQWFVLVQRQGMDVRCALTIMIYKKLLRLSKNAIEKTSTGQILNILANDLSRFEEISFQLWYLVVAPIQAITVVYIIWGYLSYSCLGGVAILFLFIPFQALMGRLFSKYRLEGNSFLTAKYSEVRFFKFQNSNKWPHGQTRQSYE